MLNISDIIETIEMINKENLDIRTVTMGISLTDCADSDIETSCEKVREKITRVAERLVPVCESIETKYGIPIINKRVSVTPIATLAGVSGGDPALYARTLDDAAQRVGVNFIGGYSALVHKGISAWDKKLIESIPRALSDTERVCSSVNIGSTRSGINMDAVRLMGGVIRETAEFTKDRECVGAAKLVVFCNAVEDNPFMAGAFHGAGEPDVVINVGVSGPGVVASALSRMDESADMTEVADEIKRIAFKITRAGQLVGAEASAELGIPFGIVDISLAPTPAVGDSVASILEAIGVDRTGGCGTTAALAMLNDAVKKGGVMASSHVGGLSGAFIPVSEDQGMKEAVEVGALTIEKLEAMTAVCSVGLDMVIIPGDTPDDVISAVIADEAAIGMVNGKTTAVRLIPAIGKKVGEYLEFGGLLGSGPVMAISGVSPARLIARGGRIPAPISSLKN
jgi:uncharacterized protein (UPF0210 family)